MSDRLGSIAPTPPQEALASFQLEPGFRLELAAGEPEVVDPIDIAWDEQGWMYVAEFRDYPNGPFEGKKAESRIRLLKDLDGDGYYESSQVYADNIHWASSVSIWRAGVFVAAPPEILYFKDTDGDGIADVRDTLFTGFGTRASEDLMNNLKLGLDGWMYGASSYNGGHVSGHAQAQESTSVQRRDFRFHPDSQTFEAISSGNGDFGNCFDDWGRRYVTNANNPLIEVVVPARYLDRNPYYVPDRVYQSVVDLPDDWIFQISPPERWRVIRGQNWEQYVNTNHDMRARRYSVKELAEGNYVTGTAGGTIYRGSQYPAAFHHTIFSAEPAANLIMHAVPESNGGSFTANRPHQEEREFLASTDNWFRPVNFANGPDGHLYLCDMYREFIEDPSAIPPEILQQMDMHHGSDRGRIWRIVHEQSVDAPLPAFDTQDDLLKALQSPDSWTRETAQRLAIERNETAMIPALRTLAVNSSLPQSRVHTLWLIWALDGLTQQLLQTALTDPHPGVRENAIRLAELFSNETSDLLPNIAACVHDQDAKVRFQAALTLGNWDEIQAVDALCQMINKDGRDPWMQRALCTAKPAAIPALMEQILLDGNPDAHLVLGSLAEVLGRGNESVGVSGIMTVLSQKQTHLSDSMLLTIGWHLAKGLEESGTTTRGQLTGKFWDRLLAIAQSVAELPSNPAAIRIQAIRLLSIHPQDVGPFLMDLMDPSETVAIQAASVEALIAQGLIDPAQMLRDLWPKALPDIRSSMLSAIRWDREGQKALLQAVQDGRIRAAEIPPHIQDPLLSHPDSLTQQLAMALLRPDRLGEKEELIQFYHLASQSLDGIPEAGKEVFQQRCASCHQVGGLGMAVGPGLLQTRDRTPLGMLTQIIDPNRSVSAQFTAYIIRTKKEESWTGMISSENAHSIKLLLPGGIEQLIARSEIQTIEAMQASLMPEGLTNDLSEQQVVDLLAFLAKPGYGTQLSVRE
ncbi:MAG: PVC-type heme-binding CxxCH protein [Bacteroidota bacterium]